jgi:transposase-like protein
MPICPNCLSRNMVKYGISKDKQRFHCQKCKLTTLYPRDRFPRKHKYSTFENGSGI